MFTNENREFLKSARGVFLALLIALSPMQSAYGQVANASMESKIPANEFYVGMELGKPLVTINLIGGVRKPGVYHIPVDTNLVQLLAYAGGTEPTSDTDNILIQRWKGEQESELLDVDLDKILKSGPRSVRLQDQDTIHIPQTTTLDSSLRTLTILSTVASIVLSFYLVDDIRRRK